MSERYSENGITKRCRRLATKYGLMESPWSRAADCGRSHCEMNKLSELEWAILDNLSDDQECPATICPEVQQEVSGASRQDVLDTLCRLHQSGQIKLMDGQPLSRDSLMSEAEGNFDTPHWFGLTPTGCAAWESGAEPPINWSDAWSAHLDYEGRRGYVEGTRRDVCLSALSRLSPDAKHKIDMTSLSHSDISGFRAKYYKHLPDGHRIDFKLK